MRHTPCHESRIRGTRSGLETYRRLVVAVLRRCPIRKKSKIKNKKMGHHAKPKRASATAPLRTGADMCSTGVGAGSRAGADKGPDRRQSNHEWTDDQAGRRRLANTDSDGDSPVHAADDTPSKNTATRDTHCNFMRRGGGRPRAAAGSRRNGTRQAVAATTGVRSEGNAASNTADAWSDPKHALKKASRRSVTASVPPVPKIPLHSNSSCSMWRHLCSLSA